MNTKICEVENKIPDLSKLIKKVDYEAKIAADYNKIKKDILDTKIKEKKLVNESNIANLI